MFIKCNQTTTTTTTTVLLLAYTSFTYSTVEKEALY